MTEETVGDVSQTHVLSAEPSRCFRVLDFAVALPPSVLQGWEEPTCDHNPLLSLGDRGIVGVITIAHKSVMVWFGWGQLVQTTTNTTISSDQAQGESLGSSVGQSTNRFMGPLMVSMPRTKYAGAHHVETASSKLIGAESEDAEMIARQMASRLSQKLGAAVFVSCSLEGAPSLVMEGVDEGMVQQRAAALAEREIFRLLQSIFNK